MVFPSYGAYWPAQSPDLGDASTTPRSLPAHNTIRPPARDGKGGRPTAETAGGPEPAVQLPPASTVLVGCDGLAFAPCRDMLFQSALGLQSTVHLDTVT